MFRLCDTAAHAVLWAHREPRSSLNSFWSGTVSEFLRTPTAQITGALAMAQIRHFRLNEAQDGRAGWRVRSFRGTKWQVPRDAETIANQINTYRVLMTRARYETVIFVPSGDGRDPTRLPAIYDAIVDSLLACGARELAQPHVQEQDERTQTLLIASARKNDALPLSPACRNWPEMAGTRPAMTGGAAMTGGPTSAQESIVRAVGII